MKYTPKRIEAWLDVHERVRASQMADIAEAVAVGTNAGKELGSITRQMRENL